MVGGGEFTLRHSVLSGLSGIFLGRCLWSGTSRDFGCLHDTQVLNASIPRVPFFYLLKVNTTMFRMCPGWGALDFPHSHLGLQ